MLALSLHQPFASLIPPKWHETRDWEIKHRGPVAIHAALKFSAMQRDLCLNDLFCHILERLGLLEISREKFDFHLPLGAIVATAIIVDCVPTSRVVTLTDVLAAATAETMLPPDAYYVDPLDYQFGNYAPGRFATRFEDVRRLETPIPFVGRQGWFNVPDELFPYSPTMRTPEVYRRSAPEAFYRFTGQTPKEPR